MNKVADILLNFENLIDQEVSICGRIVSLRKMKNLTFADVLHKEKKIQILVSADCHVSTGDWVELTGSCFRTQKGEPTVRVAHIHAHSPWKASVDYVHSAEQQVLSAFRPSVYDRTHAAYRTRSLIKEFLAKERFLEVQTPVILKHYNGGHSFPVTTQYLNESLGYNRGTMEEMMQALVGIGYERVFQIGSVFRSSKEFTFLEGYAARTDYQAGQELIRKMCAYVATNMHWHSVAVCDKVVDQLAHSHWETLDFFLGASEALDCDILNDLSDPLKLLTLCISRGLVKKQLSPESLADAIGSLLAKNYETPVVITHFPEWSSPLYAISNDAPYPALDRSRMYLPGQSGGFDVGVQENNIELFVERVERQKSRWLASDDSVTSGDSDLEKVISAGMPSMFGFGLNPDRLASLWVPEASISPF